MDQRNQGHQDQGSFRVQGKSGHRDEAHQNSADQIIGKDQTYHSRATSTSRLPCKSESTPETNKVLTVKYTHAISASLNRIMVRHALRPFSNFPSQAH